MPESAARVTDRKSSESRDMRHRELRDLFVSITGSEEFVETQEQQPTSRYVAADDSLSEPVTAIAKADGLADTFSDLEYDFENE